MRIEEILKKQGELYKDLSDNKTIKECNEKIEKPPKPEKNRYSILRVKLHKIAEYLFKEEKLKEIAESFVSNIFPYIKKNPKEYPFTVEKKPVKELENFWKDVGTIADFEFSGLEKNILSTEPSIPGFFLGDITVISQVGKPIHESLSILYGPPEQAGPLIDLVRIFQALKKGDLKYKSLEELQSAI